MPFHLTLSPGTMHGLDEPIVISFDEPDHAQNVTIVLWEADRWGTGESAVQEEGLGGNDRIAAFSGRIFEGHFQRGRVVEGEFEVDESPVSSETPDPPILRVQFDRPDDAEGQAVTHELHLETGRGEREHGVFEIVAEVTGEEGTAEERPARRRRREPDYRTPVPVFIRQWTDRRPVLAFVTDTSGYFAAARVYWDEHADGLWQEPNDLERILRFVRTAPADRGYGAWGEVNIVSHGNEQQWLMRRDASENPQRLNEEAVAALVEDQTRFEAPGEDALDEDSRIVLRGCAIGNNQALLDRIRELFGGRAQVYAPIYLQCYESSGSAAREGFWEYFVAFLLTASPSPPVAECVAALREAPDGQRASEEEFEAMLRARQGSFGRQPNEHESSHWDIRFVQEPHEMARQEGSEDEDFDEWLEYTVLTDFDNAPERGGDGMSSADWHWVIGPVQQQGAGAWRVRSRRHRTRIEVRRPMLDDEDRPVMPDLENPRHFGRSPAR